MVRQDGKNDETSNRFKVMDPLQRMGLIDGAVDAVLTNLLEIEAGQKAAQDATGNQLKALQVALKDYEEPLTEEVWDKLYRARVAERLGEAKKGGSPRYANSASRDVMVNIIKVASMGVTIAKTDRIFAPSYQAKSNIKKYADEVRPKLQKAIDLETSKPRLRSLPRPPATPKKLPSDTYYWLIGCEHEIDGAATDALRGANTIIAGSFDLEKLRNHARGYVSDYKSFLYCVAKMEPLNTQDAEEEISEMPIQNTAVLAATYSAPDHAPA